MEKENSVDEGSAKSTREKELNGMYQKVILNARIICVRK